MAATVRPSDTTTARLRPAPTPIDAAAPSSPTARLITAAAVAGPVLLLASSVAWVADADELRGILQFWAMPFLALGLIGIASRLEGPAPRLGPSSPRWSRSVRAPARRSRRRS
ncbi:hypothetical protein ACE2AJ_09440 [Aquihabitans daechungensis]|uniref:hypothetical protein n=1 Tax=Aquihabitans daechungensis TaxID=1052257 RepID=UPI003B9F7127